VGLNSYAPKSIGGCRS